MFPSPGRVMDDYHCRRPWHFVRVPVLSCVRFVCCPPFRVMYDFLSAVERHDIRVHVDSMFDFMFEHVRLRCLGRPWSILYSGIFCFAYLGNWVEDVQSAPSCQHMRTSYTTITVYNTACVFSGLAMQFRQQHASSWERRVLYDLPGAGKRVQPTPSAWSAC